jgi:hypothetical protein
LKIKTTTPVNKEKGAQYRPLHDGLAERENLLLDMMLEAVSETHRTNSQILRREDDV